MAEDIVEDIGLLDVIELRFRANEARRWKAPVREMLEKHVVGHEPRHGHDAESGGLAGTSLSRRKSGMPSAPVAPPSAMPSRATPSKNSGAARPRSNFAWRAKRVRQMLCSSSV
jgi:hypothetical protein